ncbi:MAG TPA: L,D-transpeptidase [bacterium]|nr:L,D-transpeptidase [bacterium]
MKYRAVSKLFEKTHTRSEIAEFFLSTSAHPEMVMKVLIEEKHMARLRRQARAMSPAAVPPSVPWRHVLRTAFILSLAMFLSCAVAHNNRGPGLSRALAADGPAAPDINIEPMEGALGAAWTTIKAALAGEPLPPEIADSFIGRLSRGDWAGIALIDSAGEVKALARDDGYEAMSEWVARLGGMEKENLALREFMDALQKTQATKKIYLEINLAENLLYVKMGPKTLYRFPVVTGKGYTSRESGRRRGFATPRGILNVKKKEVNPIWMPPAWNWTERGEEVPEFRYAVRGHLGRYRLNLGGGYGIHGTHNGRIKPGKYSHGCIRMNAKNLETVFKMSDVGTEVYIY